MSHSHVVIVGAGQLGSRHLQALALSEVDIQISVVDPSSESLTVAKARFGQMAVSDKVKGIEFYNHLHLIPCNVDLCVIATNANHRLDALKQLIASCQVGYILFEKVLFQSVAELNDAYALLSQHKISAWVNCPRRMFPTYQWLKQIFASQRNLVMEVKGNDWDLACNAVHFIDLWAFLGAACNYQLDLAGLSSEVLQSKRSGYMEIQGQLSGQDNQGSRFLLVCEVAGQTPNVTVRFETDGYVVEINETQGNGTIFNKLNGQSQAVDYQVVYQSGLTQKVAASLLQHGQCELTSFTDSMALHTPFLSKLGEFFALHGDVKDSSCPIT